jgi:hypothetical protein
MKSKLIAACAIGALALILVPLTVSAAGPTTVSVQVTTGTTILAPAAVTVPSGFPGQTTTSPNATVSWWSNETGKVVSAQLDGALTGTNPVHTIAASDVEVSSPTYAWGTLDAVRPVANIADVSGGTIEGASSSTFNIRVHIPSAAADTYSNTLTWSVQ